jgi:hypothetical protein
MIDYPARDRVFGAATAALSRNRADDKFFFAILKFKVSQGLSLKIFSLKNLAFFAETTDIF